jgi:hypothetical protein
MGAYHQDEPHNLNADASKDESRSRPSRTEQYERSQRKSPSRQQ